jgi:hypothetical protein
MRQRRRGEDVERLALLQTLPQTTRRAIHRHEAAAILPDEIGKDGGKGVFQAAAAITLMSAAEADEVSAIMKTTSQARIVIFRHSGAKRSIEPGMTMDQASSNVTSCSRSIRRLPVHPRYIPQTIS